jgi:hypothetical protein
MAEHYQHHGYSGEYVMLPSGEVVPADQVPQPVKPAKASQAAVAEPTDKAADK